MKLKTLALAALMAAALPAVAEIKTGLNTSNLGDAEFVLLVQNGAGSYAQDLGISINQLHTQLSTLGSFSQTVTGAQWAAFTGFGGTNSVWSIMAVQTLADGFAPGETNTWTTRAPLQPLGTIQNQQVTDASTNLAFHFVDIDNKANNTGIGQDNNRLASKQGTVTYTENFILNYNGLGFDTRNAIGQSSSMVYMTPANDVSDVMALAQTMTNSSNSAYVATFDGTTVTISATVIPAVPEPSTYAMLFAGLLAVGFIARRRAR